MPVLLFEPLDRVRLTGIGYDMFSDPQRREAILAAIETGEPRATGRVLLGQQMGSRSDARLSPVFDAGAARRGRKASRSAWSLPRSARRNCSSRALDKFPALPVHAEVFDGAERPGQPAVPFGGRRRSRHGFRDHAPAARRRPAVDHRIPADGGFHASVLAGDPGAARPVRTAARRRHRSPAALSGARLRGGVEAAGECGKEPARKGSDASGDEASHQEFDHARAGDRTPDRRRAPRISANSRIPSRRGCRRWPRRRTC